MKRIRKELSRFNTAQESGQYSWIKFHIGDDLYKHDVEIIGPTGTPYEGMLIKFQTKLPTAYPFNSPTINLMSNIIHLNVESETNSFCKNLITGKWKATHKIIDCYERIYNLLSNPSQESPLNLELGNLYSGNKTEYYKVVKQHCELYCT